MEELRRKKAIEDSGRERREYIFFKNQVRETRLDTKKRHEQGSIAFMFSGITATRALEHNGFQISTSSTNVAFIGESLSRQSSEREWSDGCMNRATSVEGLHRQVSDSSTDSSTFSRSVNRKKTDLLPTIPTPKDTSFGLKSSSRSPDDTSKLMKDRPPLPNTKSNTSTKRPTTAAPTTTSSSTLIRSSDKPKIIEKRSPLPSRKATSAPRATANDINAGNSQERVNANEIVSLPSQENCTTTSGTSKRIVTEDEAKAALAERRRIARETAEKLAESERQRKEAEELAKWQRIAEEVENRRHIEEKRLRLIDEQKKAEEMRLLRINEEAKAKEEGERKRREMKENARRDREESIRKAREEVEKQKIETAERLRKDAQEREERRRRVDEIIRKTRERNTNGKPEVGATNDENSIIDSSISNRNSSQSLDSLEL